MSIQEVHNRSMMFQGPSAFQGVLGGFHGVL